MLEQRLQQALQPSYLKIIDDSDKHIGHTGHNGGSHFTIHIDSEQFNTLTSIQSHRLIYEAVGDMIPADIHALSIKITKP